MTYPQRNRAKRTCGLDQGLDDGIMSFVPLAKPRLKQAVPSVSTIKPGNAHHFILKSAPRFVNANLTVFRPGVISSRPMNGTRCM
jgi:hypothetical protein